jgi:hypothetical protein
MGVSRHSEIGLRFTQNLKGQIGKSLPVRADRDQQKG